MCLSQDLSAVVVNSGLSVRTKQVCSGISLGHSPTVQKFTAALELPEPEVLPLYFTVLKGEAVFFEAMDTFQYSWVKHPYEGIHSPFCDTSNYELTAVKRSCSALP